MSSGHHCLLVKAGNVELISANKIVVFQVISGVVQTRTLRSKVRSVFVNMSTN